MKPITNILLLLALACYVFLPYFDASLAGDITGLGFTAGIITLNLGIKYTIFALIPFITMFLAIGFNCLRNRFWGIAVVVLIVFALYFFAESTTMSPGFTLDHDPSLAPDINEGLPISGNGVGFYSSAIFTVLALLSALVSLIPFKFNKRLEESIDKGFSEGKKHITKVGHEIDDKIHHLGKHHAGETKKGNNEAPPTATPEEETSASHEDDSRFMPKEQSIDDAHRDYMPK